MFWLVGFNFIIYFFSSWWVTLWLTTTTMIAQNQQTFSWAWWNLHQKGDFSNYICFFIGAIFYSTFLIIITCPKQDSNMGPKTRLLLEFTIQYLRPKGHHSWLNEWFVYWRIWFWDRRKSMFEYTSPKERWKCFPKIQTHNQQRMKQRTKQLILSLESTCWNLNNVLFKK